MHGEYSMSTTLTNGLKLPDKGSVDWYADMQSNYAILDGAVGTVAEHTTALSGKAPLVHIHTKSDVTDLLNSNFIPSANDAYDLGSSSYQWNNLYAKNYFYNGTAWGLDKNNKWLTTNIFYGSVPIFLRGSDNDIYNVSPQSLVQSVIRFVDKNNTTMSDIVFQHRTGETETHRLCLRQQKITSDGYYGVNLNNLGDFYPDQNNAINLGTSTNKWKSFNGINPGALSLPGSSYDPISTQNWVKRPSSSDGGFMCNIVSSVNGWICIQVSREKDFGVWVVGTFRQAFRAVQTSATTYVAMLCFPALAGSGINIYTNSVETGDADLTFNIARIYPCLGNV